VQQQPYRLFCVIFAIFCGYINWSARRRQSFPNCQRAFSLTTSTLPYNIGKVKQAKLHIFDWTAVEPTNPLFTSFSYFFLALHWNLTGTAEQFSGFARLF
jgi:hypothetical protein